MPAISRTGRGHGPLLQKIAELQSEQIYDNHYNQESLCILLPYYSGCQNKIPKKISLRRLYRRTAVRL
jgi:hypothetical protein